MILTEGANAESFYIVDQGHSGSDPAARESIGCDCPATGTRENISAKSRFFHDEKAQASIRASERGPVEVLCISYDELNELLGQSQSRVRRCTSAQMKRKQRPSGSRLAFREGKHSHEQPLEEGLGGFLGQ